VPASGRDADDVKAELLRLPAVTAVQGATVVEGNTPSTTPMTFDIVLDNPAKAGDTVQVSTSGATPGTDYVALTNVPVPLIPGATTTPLIVTVNGDNTIEADEQVTLTLSNPSPGVVLDVSSGNGTIQNDDGVPQVSIDDVTVKEGDVPSTITASFTVLLTDPAVGGETITVDTAGVTAAEVLIGFALGSLLGAVIGYVLGISPTAVAMRIEDDGPGPAVDETTAARSGRRGIADMRAEAVACGGTLDIGPVPGGSGMAVSFRWPA